MNFFDQQRNRSISENFGQNRGYAKIGITPLTGREIIKEEESSSSEEKSNAV